MEVSILLTDSFFSPFPIGLSLFSQEIPTQSIPLWILANHLFYHT